jgi:hypothetical protein
MLLKPPISIKNSRNHIVVVFLMGEDRMAKENTIDEL